MLDQNDDAIEQGALEARSKMENAARRGRPPVKKDPDFEHHNDQAYKVTAGELRRAADAFVELDTLRDTIARKARDGAAA